MLGVLLRLSHPLIPYVACWCLIWCFLSAFRSHVAAMLANDDSTFRFAMWQTHEVYPWWVYVPPGYGPWHTSGVHWIAAPSTVLSCTMTYGQLVPILTILDCSLLLTSNLLNYGTRLGLYSYLHHRHVKHHPLSWFIILPIIQQQFGSRLLSHLITSLWILPIRKLISLSDFQTSISAAAHPTADTDHLRHVLLVS